MAWMWKRPRRQDTLNTKARRITSAAPSAKQVSIVIESNTWVNPPEHRRATTAAAANSNVVAGESHAQYCPEFPVRVARLGQCVPGPVERAVCREADPQIPHALGQCDNGTIWSD